jgi:hypothetical protein
MPQEWQRETPLTMLCRGACVECVVSVKILGLGLGLFFTMEADQMWLLVDTTYGLMDGYYEDTSKEELMFKICDRLNSTYPGASFIATRVANSAVPPITDFCKHNCVTHVDRDTLKRGRELRQQEASRHDIQKAEECLLGSILLFPCTLKELESLTSFHFIDSRNQILFATIKSLWIDNPSVSITEITQSLMGSGRYDKIGGSKRLRQLAECVPNARHAHYYFEIIDRQSLPNSDREVDPDIEKLEHMLFGNDGIADWLFRIEGKIDAMKPE